MEGLVKNGAIMANLDLGGEGKENEAEGEGENRSGKPKRHISNYSLRVRCFHDQVRLN